MRHVHGMSCLLPAGAIRAERVVLTALQQTAWAKHKDETSLAGSTWQSAGDARAMARNKLSITGRSVCRSPFLEPGQVSLVWRFGNSVRID